MMNFVISQLKLFLLLYFWTYFSIFCHEMGHFVCAKLVGISPYLVKIGVGYKILKLNFFYTAFEFSIHPYGGITYVSFLTLAQFRARLILFMLGGSFANFTLLILLINSLNFVNDPIICLPIIIEIIFLLSNLIPRESLIYEKNISNDGKQIMLALRTNYKKIFENLFEVYKKQILRYKGDEEILPKTFLSNDIRILQIFLRAQTKLKNHDFEEAVELFLEVLKFDKLSDFEKAFILDNLACIVAMNGYKKYLNNADIWSQEAIQLAGQSKTLKGTRGAILIELGRYDEGKRMLLPLTEPENEAIDIAISSCYIAKAEYFLGNTETVKNWLEKSKKIGVHNTVQERIEREINHFV